MVIWTSERSAEPRQQKSDYENWIFNTFFIVRKWQQEAHAIWHSRGSISFDCASGFFLMKSSYPLARSFIFVDVIKICREKKYPKRNGIHVCVCLMPRYVWTIEIELHLFSCFARHFIVITQMPVEMTNEISIICVLDVRRQAPLKIRIARAWPHQHTEHCRPTVL